MSRSTLRATDALDLSEPWAAQPHFLSLSSSQKEERAGERRRFLSISPLSDSLPARSSRGERGKTQQVFCVPNTTGLWPAGALPASERFYKPSASVALIVLRLAEPRSVILKGCEKLAGG